MLGGKRWEGDQQGKLGGEKNIIADTADIEGIVTIYCIILFKALWKLAKVNNYQEIDRITSTGEGRARIDIELDEVM